MNANIIPIILPYLRSDADRVHLLQTCREFAALIPYTVYTDVYPYTIIKHLLYIENFRNVRFDFYMSESNFKNFSQLSGFKLGRIPKCITMLNYDSNIPIERVPEIVCDQIREIRFGSCFTYPIAGILPKSVHTVHLSYTYSEYYDKPDCNVIVYGQPPVATRRGLRLEFHMAMGTINI